MSPAKTGDAALAIQALLDALPMAAAVLDRQAHLAVVNQTWRRVAEAGGGPALIAGGLGESYLDRCRGSDEPAASRALAGLEALLAGQGVEVQLEYRGFGPSQARWFNLWAAPLPPEPGGVLLLHREISGRKRAEQALAERERELERLESVRLAARALAHRLNNHLTVPLGYLELLQASTVRPPAVQELVDEAKPALEAALADVRALLELSQPRPEPPGEPGASPTR